jgi:cytochrome c
MASKANDKLHRAARSGDVAGIAAALLAGADPDASAGTDHMSPLQEAAFFGHVAAIAALLAAGARVDGANSYAWTPLFFAASIGERGAVDALLAAGADVHRVDNGGDTALHRALSCRCLDAARVLLDAGARTGVRNKYGKRPGDVVRPPAGTRDAAATLRHRAALPRRHAQACQYSDETTKAAVTALLASAAPWSRRRPIALGCYGVEWEWEA